ncbi:MAG: AI-2E family transporter [Chloroflexota bacterium]|nr:AI-2E family transporter [Chloroflexota bacterium]
MRLFREPRLILFFVVALLFLLIVWLAWSAVAPFILGLVVAYLLTPFVNWLHERMPEQLKQRGVARPLAIFSIYLLGLLLFVLVAWLVLPPIAGQFVSLYNSVDELYERALELFEAGQTQYQIVVPDEWQARLEERAAGLAATLLDPIGSGLLATVGAVGNTLSFALGLFIVPFWLFFVLNEESKFVRGALDLIPQPLRPDVEAIRIIVDQILSAYIRGQLLVALAIGTATFLGLLLIGVEYSLLLGAAAGALAIFPFIGPILGAVPSVIVAFLQAPVLALWVIGLFVVIQQIDNIFFSPRIMGHAVALHPAIIMVAIVVGSALLGVIGALIAVPLTAILRDVIHYLYIRVGRESVGAVEALIQVGYGGCLSPLMLEAAAVDTV